MVMLPPFSNNPIHQAPFFNPHAKLVQVTQKLLTPDVFGNPQRQKLLQALRNPILFEAVLDESHKPNPEIKQLRSLLAKHKISTKELFASPELLINFYDHLAKQTSNQLKTAKTKKAQDDLKLQSLMMKSMADQIRKKNGFTLSTPTSALPVLNQPVKQSTPSKEPKFSGLFVGLFNEITKLFTEKGDWRNTPPRQRRDRATSIINKGSALACVAAGGLTKFMFADDAALTAVTVGTITRMAYGVYGIESVPEATLGVIAGKLAGARLADGLVDYAIEKGLGMIPILGEIATATTAYGLHQATGRLFLAYFEHQIANGQTPGMPTSIRSLTSVAGLADATGAVDFDGTAQENHYNTLNDARVASGSHHAAPHSFMADSGGGNGVIEVHNIADSQGNLFGHPDSDWVFNDIVSKTDSVRDARNLFEVLNKAPKGLIKTAIREMKQNGGLSGDTIRDIVDSSGDVVAGKILLLGNKDSLNNPGFLRWLKEAYENGALDEALD